jgi:hypothetical protein
LAQEDSFVALGYTPADTTQIQESTCVQVLPKNYNLFPTVHSRLLHVLNCLARGLQSVQPSVRLQQTEGYQLPALAVQPMVYQPQVSVQQPIAYQPQPKTRQSWPGGCNIPIYQLCYNNRKQRNCQQETDDIHSQFTHQGSPSTMITF